MGNFYQILIGHFISLSIQTFQPLITIWRRSNFIIIIGDVHQFFDHYLIPVCVGQTMFDHNFMIKKVVAHLEVDLDAVSEDDWVRNLHHGGLHVQGHHQSWKMKISVDLGWCMGMQGTLVLKVLLCFLIRWLNNFVDFFEFWLVSLLSWVSKLFNH